MTTTNYDPEDSIHRARGLTGSYAGGSQIIVTDGTTEVDAFQLTVAGGTVVELADGVAQINLGGGPTGGPTINVTDYGALGDGTTDDTTAINNAIDAFNTGCGRLYFPCGTYLVTGALNAITTTGIIYGDGMGNYDGSDYVSAILCSSQTANLFTVTGDTVLFQSLGLFNTYAGTPSAGSAIHVNGTFIGQKVDLDSMIISGFYDNVVRDVGAQWVNTNIFNIGAIRYAESIQNTVNQDAGDWSIANCVYLTRASNPTAAIYQTGAGGGKIINAKINCNTVADQGTYGLKRFVTGLALAMPTGRNTSVLTVGGTSIENVSGDGINISTAGTGQFGLASLSGNQVALYSNNTGRAVKISANSTGGFGTSGGIGIIVIDSLVARTDGTARAAIELVNTDRVTLGDIQLSGFNARYTSSGDTNTTDGASISYATPAIVLGTAAAAGAASTVIRSDSTIAAFDATVPVTQAFGDAAATGSVAYAARRDHVHGMPAAPTSTTDHFHIVDEQFSGDASTTVFALANEAVVDSVMAWVAGTRTPVTLGGSLNDEITFGSAPASGTLNISVDYAAVSS